MSWIWFVVLFFSAVNYVYLNSYTFLISFFCSWARSVICHLCFVQRDLELGKYFSFTWRLNFLVCVFSSLRVLKSRGQHLSERAGDFDLPWLVRDTRKYWPKTWLKQQYSPTFNRTKNQWILFLSPTSATGREFGACNYRQQEARNSTFYR